MLYEMTVGRPPFSGKTPVAIAYKHVRDQPPKPTDVAADVPMEIEAITLKLLEKDPDDRYPSAGDLRADLRRYREGHRMAAPAAAVAAQPDPTPAPQPTPTPEIPAYEEPPRRTGIFLFFMIVLLLVVTAGLFLWAETLSNEPSGLTAQASVPDVVGEEVDAAEEALRSAGFEVARDEERSDSIAAGTVIRQDPRENTPQDEGSTVTLTVSTGAGLVRLPNVVSLTELAAGRDLEALGFEVRKERTTDTSQPEGIVLEQSPQAGSEVEQGSPVILTISQGSSLLALPDVTGFEREPAQRLLELVRCTVTDVRDEPSTEVTAGLVARTEPAAGTGVDPDNCFLTLIMSTGAAAQDPNAIPSDTTPPDNG